MRKNDSDNGHSNYWVPILGAAIRVLDVFYEAKSDLSLQEVSAAAKVGKTSAFRILYTLAKAGYIEKDLSSGRYRLGLHIIAAASKALAEDNLRQIARPYLSKLLDEFQETVNLAFLDRSGIIYLDILESPQPFRIAESIGARVPWHSTALGKCIAAFLPEERAKQIVTGARLQKFTPNTITDARLFLVALAGARRTKYCLDEEESELGVKCVAAPIFDGTERVIGAVSISGPAPRVESKLDEIVNSLKRATSAISESIVARHALG